MHVVALDPVAHSGHARPALLLGHIQGVVEGRRHVLQVVGVDQQRIRQLGGGAGEFAKDQDPVPVGARGHELLGYQVHAVSQRSDEADRGRSIERRQAVAIQVLRDVVDRVVAQRGEAAVNAADHLVDPLTELAVLADGSPGRGRDLDEADAPP
jgi:hypothetical protein